jgi:hypothetical protein
MNQPIVSRETIARNAESASLLSVNQGIEPRNPYPMGSDAAMVWAACLERFQVLHSTGEVSA